MSTAFYKRSLELEENISRKASELDTLKHEHQYELTKPCRYSDVADWIKNSFSVTLILTQKAKTVLRCGKFQNIPLLCNGVRCLATDFIDYVSKKSTFEEYSVRLKEKGFEHRSDSSEAAKNNYAAYNPEYPEGSGQTVELKTHIRNKTDKSFDKHDPRSVLRIYFTYDNDLEKVIVHYLPDHLPT